MSKSHIFVWQGYWKGGAARVTGSIARYFHQKGLEVTIGVYEFNPDCRLKQLVIKELKWAPSSFRSILASLYWRLKYARQYGSVYTHTLGLWKTPNNHLFVHDAADLDDKLESLTTYSQKLAYKLWRKLYFKYCLQTATLIFSASSGFRSYLERHQIPSERIIDSGSFYDDENFKYVRRKVPDVPYKILFIGDPDDINKNFSFVKNSLYANPKYCIYAAGGEYALNDKNVFYLGYLDDKGLNEILKAADYFIMPSFSEGFSIALLEALSTGIPCLVNEVVIPIELKNCPNIIPFSLNGTNLDLLVRDCAYRYSDLSQPYQDISKYSRSKIMCNEFTYIQNAVGSLPKTNTSNSREVG